MPQTAFPFFPEGVTHITALLAFRKQDARITYFNGAMPVFIHDEDDLDSFRMITAPFCVNGNAKHADIVRAFGVTKISLERAVKRYREDGLRGFYIARKRRRQAVLTPPVLAEAQRLFDTGLETSEVAGSWCWVLITPTARRRATRPRSLQRRFWNHAATRQGSFATLWVFSRRTRRGCAGPGRSRAPLPCVGVDPLGARADEPVVEDFAKYLYLPRLRESAMLLDAITAGVALLTWEVLQSGRLFQNIVFVVCERKQVEQDAPVAHDDRQRGQRVAEAGTLHARTAIDSEQGAVQRALELVGVVAGIAVRGPGKRGADVWTAVAPGTERPTAVYENTGQAADLEAARARVRQLSHWPEVDPIGSIGIHAGVGIHTDVAACLTSSQ